MLLACRLVDLWPMCIIKDGGNKSQQQQLGEPKTQQPRWLLTNKELASRLSLFQSVFFIYLFMKEERKKSKKNQIWLTFQLEFFCSFDDAFTRHFIGRQFIYSQQHCYYATIEMKKKSAKKCLGLTFLFFDFLSLQPPHLSVSFHFTNSLDDPQ